MNSNSGQSVNGKFEFTPYY